MLYLDISTLQSFPGQIPLVGSFPGWHKVVQPSSTREHKSSTACPRPSSYRMKGTDTSSCILLAVSRVFVPFILTLTWNQERLVDELGSCLEQA